MKHILSCFLIGAGLTACSSLLVVKSENAPITVESAGRSNPEMDSIIAPYSRLLAKEMNVIIGKAMVDMTSGRPNSNLGDWVCNQLMQFGKDSLNIDQSIPIVSILNTGGLRATISKGPITIGDIFKVMPFDNQLIVLKLSTSKIPEIIAYLKKSGGEPISGFKIVNGEWIFDQKLPLNAYFWVVTTDFLANGGDKMSFFQSPIESIVSKTLVRDLLINSVRKTGEIGTQTESKITW